MDKKKLKIAVVTPNLSAYGGVTKCAVSAIEALNEKGIIPDVFTIAGKQEEISRKFGKNLRYNFKKLFAPKRFALYSMITKLFQMLFADYDYIYDFTNSIPLNSRRYFSYIHFPEYIVAERGKYRSGLWSLYSLPKRIMNPISKYALKNYNIDFACNSKFTAKRVYETVGRRVPVVYPPCSLSDFANKNKKGRNVVSVAGFTPEKNQEMQVKIASNFPDANFEIYGSATRNPRYLKKIKSLSRGLKNVHLHPNAPFSEVKKTLASSLVFIHTSENEPFGISIVEAIAAGCIPLVHNSGGPIEIVPFSELRFNTEREAVKKLRSILRWSDKKIAAYRKKFAVHIKNYNDSVFKAKLIECLKNAG